MKFLVSYYNHKAENKSGLATYFEAQRLNMQRLGYANDLLIVSNEDLQDVEPFHETPYSEYKFRYLNKYVALKQVLARGEAVLMMDHDVFITRTLKLPDDMHTAAIYSSSVVGDKFSEQMAFFTTATYPYVARHIDSFMSGNLSMRTHEATAKRHDNCYSSEGTQHNKSFQGIPLFRSFSCYDTLMETPYDSFADPDAKPLTYYLNTAPYNIYDGVHAHISSYQG